MGGPTNLQSQSNESSEAIPGSAKSILYCFESITVFNQLIQILVYQFTSRQLSNKCQPFRKFLNRISRGGGTARKLSLGPNLGLKRHAQLGSVCSQTWRRNLILSLYSEEQRGTLYKEAGFGESLRSCGRRLTQILIEIQHYLCFQTHGFKASVIDLILHYKQLLDRSELYILIVLIYITLTYNNRHQSF